MELGSTDVGKLVIQRLRELSPGIWIAGVEKRPDYKDSAFDLVVTNQLDAFFGRYESVNMPSLAVTPELSELIAPYEAKLLNAAGLAGIRDTNDYPPPLHGVPVYSESYEARKDLLYRHVRFWNHVFDVHGIQAVFHENLGQEIFDYVALQLARARGIPTLTFNISGQFPQVLFVQESERELGDLGLGFKLKEIIGKNLQEERADFITKSVGRFAQTADSGLATAVQQYETSPVKSWLLNRNIYEGRITLPLALRAISAKIFRFLDDPVIRFRRFRRTRALVRDTQRSYQEESSFSTKWDCSEPFLYFPLHFQPETSSSVKGRNFYVLREAVAFVASELPTGWKLVVKEHPHQFRRLLKRPEGFYAQLVSIPNVILTNHAANNETLVQEARAVISVSHSSITSFALFMGKPVISLGDSHFREAFGYHCVTSTSELRITMAKIANGWDQDRPSLRSDFLEQLSRSTFEGEFGEKPDNYSDDEWERLQALTGQNIGAVITEWLKLKGIF